MNCKTAMALSVVAIAVTLLLFALGASVQDHQAYAYYGFYRGFYHPWWHHFWWHPWWHYRW
jgi:hypothetical protein